MPFAEGSWKETEVGSEAASAAGGVPRQASISQDFSPCNSKALAASVLEVDLSTKVDRPWLRTDWDCGRIFGEKYGPCLESERATYFTISANAEHALVKATNELHKLFLYATAYVLEGGLGEAAPQQFDIPAFLWPHLQASWQRGGGCGGNLLFARFDMALTPQGPKCYEYNCDSASGLFECAYIQGAYAQAIGAVAGRSAGHGLHQRLVETWRRLQLPGLLHIVCDDVDVEERYHAEYMKAVAEEAGILCKLIVGDPSLEFSWTTDGKDNIQDVEGTLVRTVWKTWSWRTAVAQLQDRRGQEQGSKYVDSCAAPSLAELLFHPCIQTIEPSWTLVTSSKALLPVLWRLFPYHPCLLVASCDVTESLWRSGYAIKPINGRGGTDVRLVSGGQEQEKEKLGDSGTIRDSVIYQETCALPRYGKHRVQLCPWIVAGTFAGTVLRADEKDVLEYDSPVYPLRIVEAVVKKRCAGDQSEKRG